MSAELLKTLCYFLTGGFLIFLAITITRDNFTSRLNRVTGAMLFFVALGPIFMALGTISTPDAGSILEGSAVYGIRTVWEFFFPLLLIFSWLFPFDRMKTFRHPRLRYLVFLPQVLHLVVILFFGEIIGLLDLLQVEPSDSGLGRLILQPVSTVFSWLILLVSVIRTYEQAIFGAINLVYILTAVYFLETGKRYTTNPRILTQTRWVLWGTRIGLGLFAVAQLGTILMADRFSEQVVSSIIIVALLISSGLFIFATIRHQFLDVQMVFRQSFVNTITSALLVAVFVLLVVQSRRLLATVFGGQAELISYGFVILILLFFQPINNWLDNLVRSMFIRTRTDHRNVLERFSRQVISEFDPAQLRRIIEEMLKTTLLVDRVYFALYDDTIAEYAVLSSEDYPRRIVVDRDDLLLRGINLLDSPAYYHSLSDYRDNSELATVLEGRGIRMILPMKDAEHMLGFVALTGKAAGYRYSSEDLNLLGVLSNQMVGALTNARLYVESLERLRLQEEVTMARQIQIDLLPAKPPQMEGSAICAHSTPSRTIGGDFYDFIRIGEDRLGMVIADASGKGMPAALMITQTQAIIRSEVNNGSPIAAMLRNTNQQLVEATSAEKYVTLFYGELDVRRREFHYVNAGHNYPILVRADGSVELLKAGGPVVGAFPSMEYESSTVKLESDDLLFLFTDGLSEAMDNREVEYGEERIRKFVSERRRENPQTIMEAILEDVRTHDPTYPPQDDTTIVALKMNGRSESDAT